MYFVKATAGWVFEAGLGLSKASWSRSAAFGEFINPDPGVEHAARRAQWPLSSFGLLFCYDFPGLIRELDKAGLGV